MKRPIGVYILIILAGLAALVAVYYTLVFLNIVNPFLGDYGFFGVNWLGALMQGLLAVIWISVMVWLWNLDPRGWLFVSALSALNLVLAFVYILGDTTFNEMLPAIVINGLILIYSQLPGTKAAFGR